jgi:penicillin-binding protein 1C
MKAALQWKIGLVLIFLIIATLLVTPVVRFDPSYSTVLLSEDGRLLGAKIARDEQWRFPSVDSIPYKCQKALLTFEDKRFFVHNGIDVLSLTRALRNNFRAGKIVSGGSTISMQLARIYRGNPPRTLLNKILEMLIAWKSEQIYTKKQLLEFYLTQAPFGGNIVGLETAAWRYFNKAAVELSWAEASTLAVLPNSPALIHPGKNRQLLLAKRNSLLRQLYEAGKIDEQEYALSLLEALPEKPFPIPDYSLHLVDYFNRKEGRQAVHHSSVDLDLQLQCNQVARSYADRYAQNGIHNLAIMVVENESAKVLAYVGNTGRRKGDLHEYFVDMLQAGRSSGSILKPLLYAHALNEGLITQKQLLADVPGNISGYRPRNFNRTFEGAVPADRALIRSLNVPFVYLLQAYTIEKFLYQLQEYGFKEIDRTAAHYGLPLILGGADVRLWELVGVYSSLARRLNHFNLSDGKYFTNDMAEPVLTSNGLPDRMDTSFVNEQGSFLSAGAIWLTFEVMTKLERPDGLGQWQQYQSARRIAWKTGTSFGMKDAWSVGISRDYTVGVWVGNATGEGRPGLVGVKMAAPVLFEVFSQLPSSPWFEEPSDDLKYQSVCEISGFPAGPACEKTVEVLVPYRSRFRSLCPYHRRVQLDESLSYRLGSDCDSSLAAKSASFFILPPLMEYFYARAHPEYAYLPPYHPSCGGTEKGSAQMALIYPANPTRIKIPRLANGEKGRVVFRLAHRSSGKKVFWYLDDEFLTTTQEFHEIELYREPGSYLLMLLDEDGEKLFQRFSLTN